MIIGHELPRAIQQASTHSHWKAWSVSPVTIRRGYGMTSNLLECTLHKYPQIYCTDPRLPTFPVHNNLQKSGCSIPADCKDIFIEHVPHPALHLEEVLEDHPHRGHEQ
jgi:hypothetical protein